MDRILKTATVLILCLFVVIVLEGSYITPGFPPGGVTNSTPVTVSAATTNDQQMMELALPAGFLNSLGKSFDIFSAGFYTLPATASLTHKIKLCTVSGCGSGTVVTLYSTAAGSSAGSVTNSNWSMRAVAIVATAGASGNLEVHGRTMIELTAPNTPVTPYQDANTTVSSPNIDLTAALFLDFTVAFSTSSVSNTAIQRSGSITPQAAGAAASGGGSGGGGTGALTQISKQVLGAPASNITFSSIPGTFNNLLLTLDAASAGAVALDNMAIAFNNDNGTNYNFMLTLNSGGSGSTFNTASVAGNANQGCGALVGASAPAGESSHDTISVLNYAGTTFRKHATCFWGSNGADASGNANNDWGSAFVVWKNTAAVTSIKLVFASGNNFVTGSTAILYGEN